MRISDWSSDVCSSDLTDGPVTIVTINRPHVRNAVDNETAAALTAAFRAFDADATARVAILTGAGGTFCSGADLKALASWQDYEAWRSEEHTSALQSLMRRSFGVFFLKRK